MLVLCGVSQFLSLYYKYTFGIYGFMLARVILLDMHVVSCDLVS